jgi:hypothetical protein
MMSGPTNDDRARWAEAGLAAFLAAGGGHREPIGLAIGDLIAALLHLAWREGCNTVTIIRRARRDFTVSTRAAGRKATMVDHDHDQDQGEGDE